MWHHHPPHVGPEQGAHHPALGVEALVEDCMGRLGKGEAVMETVHTSVNPGCMVSMHGFAHACPLQASVLLNPCLVLTPCLVQVGLRSRVACAV